MLMQLIQWLDIHDPEGWEHMEGQCSRSEIYCNPPCSCLCKDGTTTWHISCDKDLPDVIIPEHLVCTDMPDSILYTNDNQFDLTDWRDTRLAFPDNSAPYDVEAYCIGTVEEIQEFNDLVEEIGKMENKLARMFKERT